MSRCPHGCRSLRIPEYAQRNMESYGRTVTTITECCGKLIYATPHVSFHAEKSGLKIDDWGHHATGKRA